jgi:hypothetical protein
VRVPGWLLLGFVAIPLAVVACTTKNGAGDDSSTTPSSTTPNPTPSLDPNAPKYHEDVQPIVYNHCQSCHTTGGLAPAIDTYPIASTLSALMDQRTADRSMPPWPPEPSCGQDYRSARLLSAADQDTIHRWWLGGSQEGNPANAPTATPTPVPLPSPDKVLDPGADFSFGGPTAPADLYECFRLKTGLPANADFIRAQVTPGNKAIVHHIILYKEANGADVSKPAGDIGECGGVPGGSPEFLVGWVPGAAPLEFPADTGMALASTDAIVMQVHYHNNGTPQTDHSMATLWYASAPVTNHARVIWGAASVGPGINGGIPAGQSDTETGSCTVPSGQNPVLLGVAPHMHTHGTQFDAQLTPAGGGAASCLIDIAHWDFGWQGGYMYNAPIQLHSGDKISTTCTWNNTTGSTLHFGEGTGDEMCFDFMYMVGWSGSQYCFGL